MAALRGCDSPFAIAAHAALLRLRGIDFVMRRYSRDPSCNLDVEEARRLSGAGLRLGALLESCVGVESLSRRQGLLDGADALRLARAAGQPPGSAIYFGLGVGATRADIDGVLHHYQVAPVARAGAAGDGSRPIPAGRAWGDPWRG